MTTLNDAAKEKGFEGQNELLQMAMAIDLSDNQVFNKFEDWKKDDGTCNGLEQILSFQKVLKKGLLDMDKVTKSIFDCLPDTDDFKRTIENTIKARDFEMTASLERDLGLAFLHWLLLRGKSYDWEIVERVAKEILDISKLEFEGKENATNLD